jgi:hypothetical protein
MMMDYATNSKINFEQFSATASTPYNKILISAYTELIYKYQKMGLPFNFVNTNF